MPQRVWNNLNKSSLTTLVKLPHFPSPDALSVVHNMSIKVVLILFSTFTFIFCKENDKI